jgi:hypothetical protein
MLPFRTELVPIKLSSQNLPGTGSFRNDKGRYQGQNLVNTPMLDIYQETEGQAIPGAVLILKKLV